MGKQRVACLYWPTSSVGGINTELRAFRDEAERRGDTFHVLRSGKQSTLMPCAFESRKLIRGGDTFITIDGEAPHAPNRLEQTLDFLQSYDRVYLAYLCPHPTKDYGEAPLFLPLLRGLAKAGVPITARVTDGYWESYAEWGEETIKLCKAVTVSQPAFASFFKHPRVKASRFPFSPRPVLGKEKRSPTPLTVWTSQWKAIKGIHKLLPHIPEIKHRVEMYSNGILYYQLRETADWKRAIKKDHFKGFNGNPKTSNAEFFGYIPLEQIPGVLARAWFMIDLMGIGKPKNKVYTEGSFNNTTTEALWYGACPVLHEQAKKAIPADLALWVAEASDVPRLLNSKDCQRFALDPKRQAAAKKWVKENFDAAKVYDTAILGRF